MNLLSDWLFKNKKTKANKDTQFLLKYGNLKIGKLYREKEEFIFEYEDDFKKQTKIKPLVSFLDKSKKYQSKNLFPFFVARIPEPNRPIIKEEIKEKEIDKNDVFELLKYFGRRNGDNPFILEYEKH